MNTKEMDSRAGLKEMPNSASDSLQNPKQWFVMRDLKRYNAKLPAYRLLEKKNIRCYTPMQEQLAVKGEKRIRQVVPVIRDLLFAYDTYECIEHIVEETATLQFRFQRGKYKDPMVVRESDMENFIQAGEDYRTTRYYAPEELTPRMLERRVRIIGGPFDRREGTLVTTRGSKTKRLLVGIPSLIYKSVAVHHYDFIEFL